MINYKNLAFGLMERMDRARSILTNGKPTPECNWGVLDTFNDREKIRETKNSKEMNINTFNEMLRDMSFPRYDSVQYETMGFHEGRNIAYKLKGCLGSTLVCEVTLFEMFNNSTGKVDVSVPVFKFFGEYEGFNMAQTTYWIKKSIGE